MADARALLRAHRAENRIKHPHAAYSDAGKLLCKLCHDVVKAESLWDTHIRGQIHRQRLQAMQRQSSPVAQGADGNTNKRKRGEDADEPMSDGEDNSETIPTKRSKTDAAPSHITLPNGIGNGLESSKEKDKEKTQTPPSLARRTSGTPIQGVEIAIPSRPATPLTGSASTVSTPKTASIGRAARVGSDPTSTVGSPATALLQHRAAASIPISNEALSASTSNAMRAPPTGSNSTAAQAPSGVVDEAEWAAFESEMAVLDAPAPPPTAKAHLYADATISAPALTTAQVAAKSQEEENERRKRAAEAEMADEREDATRALEDEFDDMAELEGRVRRLKERREELRKESVMNLRAAATTVPKATVRGKENVHAGEDPAEDDEDEDEEEDEWDGFRFRV